MWRTIALFILRNRFPLGIATMVVVGLLATQIRTKFSTSNAQLLPSSHPAMQHFQDFVQLFGQEDNLVAVGFSEGTISREVDFQAFAKLASKIADLNGINQVFTPDRAVVLEKDTLTGKFLTRNIAQAPQSLSEWNALKESLGAFPFYDQLIFSHKSGAWQMAIYLKPEVVDSKFREDLVIAIDQAVKSFEQETGKQLYLSGMPVIRTMNTQEVKSESTLFILLALGVTCAIFLLFYRSFLATLTSMLVVVSAVICSFATLSIFGYPITILTALVPPLLIVIGIPNCIFLINKYQQEFNQHGNKMLALFRMIKKVGTAALLTNVTTAFGFFTFVFTESETLQQFGVVASLNILGIFVLSFLIIPIAFSFLPTPGVRQLRHLENGWLSSFLHFLQRIVQYHRPLVYVVSIVFFVLSLFGIFLLSSSGNMLDDMSKDAPFYKDIGFFDEEFGGIVPLEIFVETKQGSLLSSGSLRSLDALESTLDSLPQASNPVSVLRLVKFSKQAYYNNDSAYYSIPGNQERNFIMSYVKNSTGDFDLLKNYIDSTQSKMRITTMLTNMPGEELEQVVATIQNKVDQTFDKQRYNAGLTGAAYLFLKGTDYLAKNLLVSLGLAIVIISLFMAFMFRSWRMIFVALIPNFLPLLITAGIMGYLGIHLKPSTILVFSVAFGIAVDDTIHFLAKYRQELTIQDGNIRGAVLKAIEETGQSMFYTSVVLFAGFFVFTLSGFMGIVALGGLVSLTLAFALLTNLVLLPALLLTYEDITHKPFIEEHLDYFEINDDEIDEELLELPESRE